MSQRRRKLVEKVFGWSKLDRVLRQVKLRGSRKSMAAAAGHGGAQFASHGKLNLRAVSAGRSVSAAAQTARQRRKVRSQNRRLRPQKIDLSQGERKQTNFSATEARCFHRNTVCGFSAHGRCVPRNDCAHGACVMKRLFHRAIDVRLREESLQVDAEAQPSANVLGARDTYISYALGAR